MRHVLQSKKEDLPVPSLQEIQQTLVDIGDKPASFVSSREWIGSVEACLCVDQIFGVGLCIFLFTFLSILFVPLES